MARLPAGASYNDPNITLVGYNPAPGPQQPGKYPTPVGLAYQRWGEQPGYVYSPYDDTYHPDPQTQQKFYEESGLQPKKPKQPGALEGLGTVAAGAGAAALGSQLIKDPSKVISGIKSIPSALGLGSETGGATSAGAASAGGAGSAAAPTAAGTAGGGGLIGVSGAAPAAPSFVGAGSAPAAPQLVSAVGSGGAGAPAGWAGTLGSVGGVPVLPAAGAVIGTYLLDRGVSGLLGKQKNKPIGLAARTLVSGGLWPAIHGIRGLLEGSDEWKQEKNKLEKLSESGAYIPPGLIESMPTKGRKLEDLIRKDMPADFVGRDPQGNWVNNKFANDRNVKNLVGTDIVNFSAMAERDPQWFTKPLDQRIAIAQHYLDIGAVDEGHGSVKLDSKKIDANPYTGAPAAPAPQPVPQAPQGSNVTVAPPPKGTRLSPGVYADGRGGSTRR